MPEYNPEQFMDVEAFDFYGPNYKELKPQYEGKQAAEPALEVRPTSTPDPVAEPVSDAPEATEEAETTDADITFSDVYRDITEAVGAAEADATHEWMNNNSSEEEIANYLGMIKDGDQSAVAIFQAAQVAREAGYESSEVEASSFTEDTSYELTDRYGDAGNEMVQLNKQLIAGEISASELKMQVLRDPSLLRAALDAQKNGLISF